MLRDERVDVEAAWAVGDGVGGGGDAANDQTDRDEDTSGATYREIDRQLRRLAKRRAALDSEEARWLREADAQQIWKKLGFSTALEYLEDVFGYAPRTALERLRVAKELGRLTQLDASLAHGELTYGAARELSRVMTAATEHAWLARARGKNLRDIEELVAGHAKGDDPDDPKDESQQPRIVSFRLTPAIEALLRQTRADLSDECGHHVEDDELFEILCRRAREGGDPRDGAPAPAYQYSIRRCDGCGRSEQLAAGQWTPISRAAAERAECDAIAIGDEADLDVRASRTVPKKPREHVWLRDAGRCRVPGCRAKRNCDLHHIVHWAHGGTHDPENLIVLCSGHHTLLHEGLLTVTGRAPDELTFTRDGKPLVDPRSAKELAAREQIPRSPRGAARTAADVAKPRAGRANTSYGDVVMRTEAKVALRQLGYKAGGGKGGGRPRVCRARAANRRRRDREQGAPALPRGDARGKQRLAGRDRATRVQGARAERLRHRGRTACGRRSASGPRTGCRARRPGDGSIPAVRQHVTSVARGPSPSPMPPPRPWGHDARTRRAWPVERRQ